MIAKRKWDADTAEHETHKKVVQSWGGMMGGAVQRVGRMLVARVGEPGGTMKAAGACSVLCGGAKEIIGIGLDATLLDLHAAVYKAFPTTKDQDLRFTVKKSRYIEMIATKDSDLDKFSDYKHRERVKSPGITPPEVATYMDDLDYGDKILLVRAHASPALLLLLL